MSRTKFSHRHATAFVGLAVVILVGAASLAQAQGPAQYWNNTGSAAWSGTGHWASATFGGNPEYYWGGMVINNGGTATIGTGDSVTDTSNNGSPNANIFIGGSTAMLGGSGGNGYVTMSGGTLSSPLPLQEVLGVDAGGSGIFTQSGGINVPFLANVPSDTTVNYNYLQLGANERSLRRIRHERRLGRRERHFRGGPHRLGEYPRFPSRYGLFNQTGGSIGSLSPLGEWFAVGLAVGGDFYRQYLSRGQPLHLQQQWKLYARRRQRHWLAAFRRRLRGCGRQRHRHFHPELRHQRHRRRSAGFYTAGGDGSAYNTGLGTLILGYYSGKQKSPGIGYYGNGVGTYNLNAGLLTGDATGSTGGLEIVGVTGSGYFNQSGGTNIATATLYVGGAATANQISGGYQVGYGIYTLTDGLLQVPNAPNRVRRVYWRWWHGDLQSDGRNQPNRLD